VAGQTDREFSGFARRLVAALLVSATMVAAPASPELLAARSIGGTRTASGQSGGGLPVEAFVDENQRNAVLLEDGTFFAAPTSDGEIVTRWPAGSVLAYVGESTDSFGRSWSTLRHPDESLRRSDIYLAPFDQRQFVAFGGVGAVLADRQPSIAPVPAATGAAAAAILEAPPWWAPVAVVTFGNSPKYVTSVATSAWAVDEAHLLEAIDLLGGMDAIAGWPADPLPGELYLPELLPAMFQFDGTRWQVARPIRMFFGALNLIGNPRLREDHGALPLAGGPAIGCWDLVGALTPRGLPAGGIVVAPPPVAASGPTAAPPVIKSMWPPAPLAALVPPRVDPPEVSGGILINDANGRQALYVEQTFGPGLTRRLRGREMVLDVVARAPATAVGAATLGVHVEVFDEDGETVDDFPMSFTVGATSTPLSLSFTVAETSETIAIRVLPLDRSLAVAQSGAVIVDRVSLRLAHWDPIPPPAPFVLKRITVTSFEGRSLHTRAPVALTTKSAAEIAEIWPQVQAATEWSLDDKERILAGEVRPGMSPEQVRLSWGEPDEVIPHDPASGIEREWRYTDRKASFADGKVFAAPRDEFADRATARLICPGVPRGPDRSR